VSFASLVACSSLLGDFTVGPTPASDGGDAGTSPDTSGTPDGPADGPGTSDASDAQTSGGDTGTDSGSDAPILPGDAGDSGSDATVPPGDAGDSGSDGPGEAGDAASDGPTTPPVLTCDTWRFGSPIQVVNLLSQPAGQRTLAANPVIFPANSMDSAFVAVSPAPQDFQVYQVLLNRAMVNPLTPNGTHGSIDSFFFTQDGVALFTADPTGGGPGTNLVVTDIPGTTGGGSPIPSGTTLAMLTGGLSYFTSTAQEIPPGAYTYAYTNSPSAGQYALYAGLTGSTVGPRLLTTSASRDNVDSPKIVHANGVSYIFIGGNPTANSPAGEWRVPDDPSAAITGPRLIPSPTTSFGLNVAPNSSPARINVAFADVNLAVTPPTFALRVGSLDVSKANSFGTTDLPVGMTFNSLASLPINGGMAYWQGDQFIMIGTGQGGSGVNFLWVDSNGNLLGQALPPNNILSTDTNISLMGAAFSSQVVIPALASIDVAWSDRLNDAMGMPYDVVYANQLNCH
jgi:hypothetical protein